MAFLMEKIVVVSKEKRMALMRAVHLALERVGMRVVLWVFQKAVPMAKKRVE